MKRFAWLPLLALAAAAGCETEDLYENGIEIQSWERLESGLAVWFDSPAEEIVLLEVSATGVGVRELFRPRDGERILRMEAGPDASAPTELYIFTEPVDEREIDIVDSVTRIRPAVAGEPQRFEVGSYFGALEFHPGLRYGLLYHPSADQYEASGLFNQNEVGVLDLGRAPAADNPRLFTVSMGGRSVTGVDFPGAMSIAGTTRDLAVFESDGAVALVDLADAALEPVTVKLKNESDTREIVPEQVLPRAGDAAHAPMLLLRTNGAQEIFALSLVARPDGQAGFAAALNQYDSGLWPSAMCLAEDGDHPLLVIAGDADSAVAVVDIETADSFQIQLNAPVSALFSHTRSDGANEVVMYGTASWVDFLAVDDLAEEKGSNLDELFVEGGIESARQLSTEKLIAVPYSGEGLVIIDLAEREVTQLSSNDWYDWSEARVWGNTLFYAGEGDDRVIDLDLAIGHPEPLVLDEPVYAFEIFPQSSMGLVLHDRASGRATLFPLDDPTREAAFVVDGLWIRNLLDAEGKGVAR